MKTERNERIRSRALQLLDIAGYIPKGRLRQAMRIAARCEGPIKLLRDKLPSGPREE